MHQYTPNIGQEPSADARRDCIHFALAPVEAGEKLLPGWRVRLTNHKAYRAREWIDETDGEPHTTDQIVGIVDPFLTKAVYQGQRFWLMLFPGTVTSMRHVWSHPAFEPKLPVKENCP